MTENEEINAMLFAEVRSRQMRNASLLFGSKEQQQPPQLRGVGQPVPSGAGPVPREAVHAAANRQFLRLAGYPTPGER